MGEDFLLPPEKKGNKQYFFFLGTKLNKKCFGHLLKNLTFSFTIDFMKNLFRRKRQINRGEEAN